MTFKKDLTHFENRDRDSSNLTANSGLSREAVETVPLSFDVTEQAGFFNEFELRCRKPTLYLRIMPSSVSTLRLISLDWNQWFCALSRKLTLLIMTLSSVPVLQRNHATVRTRTGRYTPIARCFSRLLGLSNDLIELLH